MKEKASGDDLYKSVEEHFGGKPDSLLLRFIRARKFDVTRAHELMRGKNEILIALSIYMYLSNTFKYRDSSTLM